MGGHVTLLGMHEFPTAFAGGLAMCPAGPELFDFFAATAGAAEVITGVQARLETMQADVAKMNELLGKPGDYTDKGRQLASVEIQISGGPRPFAMEGLASGGRFAGNISPAALAGSTTPSNRAVMTTQIKYGIDEQLGLTADALNKTARRKALDAEIRNPMGPYDELVPFDGKLERPTLTMHGTGDLFVPIFLEQSLKRAVAAAGKDAAAHATDLPDRRTLRLQPARDDQGVRRPHRLGAQGHQTGRRRGQRGLEQRRDDLHRSAPPERSRRHPRHRRIEAAVNRHITSGLALTMLGAAALGTQFAAQQPPNTVDFARDVQPILRQHCYSCHGPSTQQNGFRLDRRSDAMRGGSMAMIGPGNSEGSRLYLRLIGNSFGTQMPPTGALTPAQITTIKNWIDLGAPWPDSLAGEAPRVVMDPAAARLMDAALWGSTADVVGLLDAGADPNARNEAGATPLMRAVDDLDTTRALLEYGADPNVKSDEGRTPLLMAAQHFGAAPVVRLLLAYGANPSAGAPGLGGNTSPLIEASYRGDAAVMRLLLDAGAQAKEAGAAGVVMSLMARCSECFELLAPAIDAQALSDAAIGLSPPDYDGTMIGPLLTQRGSVNAKDSAGRSMLMRAAASDAMPVAIVKMLIAQGADVNVATPSGETALSLASLRGHTPVVDLLVKSGARATTPAQASEPPRPSPGGVARRRGGTQPAADPAKRCHLPEEGGLRLVSQQLPGCHDGLGRARQRLRRRRRHRAQSTARHRLLSGRLARACA